MRRKRLLKAVAFLLIEIVLIAIATVLVIKFVFIPSRQFAAFLAPGLTNTLTGEFNTELQIFAEKFFFELSILLQKCWQHREIWVPVTAGWIFSIFMRWQVLRRKN